MFGIEKKKKIYTYSNLIYKWSKKSICYRVTINEWPKNSIHNSEILAYIYIHKSYYLVLLMCLCTECSVLAGVCRSVP